MSMCFPQDYELQVVTYKALVEPLASPLRKTKMECASDNIIQEVGHIDTMGNLFNSILQLQ